MYMCTESVDVNRQRKDEENVALGAWPSSEKSFAGTISYARTQYVCVQKFVCMAFYEMQQRKAIFCLLPVAHHTVCVFADVNSRNVQVTTDFASAV